MEQTIEKRDLAQDVANALILIRRYRTIEKASLKAGFNWIKRFCGDRSHLVSHLCGHWKGKQKQFGTFYLNLDYKFQYAVLTGFGLNDLADENYIQRSEEDPRAMLFEKPTGFLSVARKLLIFFENHGISQDPTGDGSIQLVWLPSEELQYGNSSNWGDYLLRCTYEAQVRIIYQILTRGK